MHKMVTCYLYLVTFSGVSMEAVLWSHWGRGRIPLDISLGKRNKPGDSIQKQSLILSHPSLIPGWLITNIASHYSVLASSILMLSSIFSQTHPMNLDVSTTMTSAYFSLTLWAPYDLCQLKCGREYLNIVIIPGPYQVGELYRPAAIT